MRCCANPTCRREITACNGFVKASDQDDFLADKISAEQIRELCGKCGFLALLLEDRGGDALRRFFIKIGYYKHHQQLLLPAPT
jgi:hypothetical protein